MHSRLAVALIIGLALGLPATVVASQAKAANDASAKLCQKDGWQHWVRADQTPFLDQSACVSYGAHGGIFAAPQATGEALCESYGGSFGNTNLTMGSWPTILWTCNGFPYVAADDLQARYVALGNACLAGGGTGYALRGVDATLLAYFTCGHS